MKRWAANRSPAAVTSTPHEAPIRRSDRSAKLSGEFVDAQPDPLRDLRDTEFAAAGLLRRMDECERNAAAAGPRSDAAGDFDPQHARRWWEITRSYLFADRGGAATQGARRSTREYEMTAHIARCEARHVPLIAAGERGTWTELARWAHRQALHLLREAARSNDDPLRGLERALRLQLAFVAGHPAVPAHLLDALARPSEAQERRRIGNAIGHYEARLAGWIERAQRGGQLTTVMDAREAARLMVALLLGLLLQMRVGRHAPDQLPGRARQLLPILLNGLRDDGVRLG